MVIVKSFSITFSLSFFGISNIVSFTKLWTSWRWTSFASLYSLKDTRSWFSSNFSNSCSALFKEFFASSIFLTNFLLFEYLVSTLSVNLYIEAEQVYCLSKGRYSYSLLKSYKKVNLLLVSDLEYFSISFFSNLVKLQYGIAFFFKRSINSSLEICFNFSSLSSINFFVISSISSISGFIIL